MAYENLIYEKVEDGIARITLNRPEVLNALNVPLLYEIYEAAEEAARDNEIAVLVYRGAGRAFCAGRDFKYSGMLQTEDPQGWYAWRRSWKGLGTQTWFHPKVTVAQVHGYALGGGLHLSVLSDITIAAEGTKFGYPEARYGILAGEDHFWNLLCGPKKTKEWLLTGRNIDAKEAYEWGMINAVVPAEKLEETVMTLAKDLVTMERKNPGYLRANKWEVTRAYPEMYRMAMPMYFSVESQAHREYFLATKESQERFYTKVAKEGIHAALDEMHEGFSGKR